VLERRFELEGGGEVVLTVEAPRPDGQDFRCSYRIAWPDETRDFYGMGVDSLQALMLGLANAHVDLLASPEGRRGELRWLGMGDLGLPLAKNVTAADFIDKPDPPAA